MAHYITVASNRNTHYLLLVQQKIVYDQNGIRDPMLFIEHQKRVFEEGAEVSFVERPRPHRVVHDTLAVQSVAD